MQSHYPEAAARRHVDGLLSMRIAGMSIDSVYKNNGGNPGDPGGV